MLYTVNQHITVLATQEKEIKSKDEEIRALVEREAKLLQQIKA